MQDNTQQNILNLGLDFIPKILEIPKHDKKRKTIIDKSQSWGDTTLYYHRQDKQNNKFQGTLIQKCNNMFTRQYTGQFHQSFKLDGRGILTIKRQGQIYFQIKCNCWKQNQPNGYCQIINSLDSTLYIGDMKNWKKEGLGKVTFESVGVQVSGLWKNGVLSGEVQITKDNIMKKAIYQNNKFVRYI